MPAFGRYCQRLWTEEATKWVWGRASRGLERTGPRVATRENVTKRIRDEEGGAAGRNFQISVQRGVQRSVQRGFSVRRTSAAQVLVPLALWVPREQTGEYTQEQPREQPRELFVRIRGTRCRRSWCSAPAFLWDALTATCACTSTELQRARARVPWRRMEGVLDEEGGEGARAQGDCAG